MRQFGRNLHIDFPTGTASLAPMSGAATRRVALVPTSTLGRCSASPQKECRSLWQGGQYIGIRQDEQRFLRTPYGPRQQHSASESLQRGSPPETSAFPLS